MKARLNPLYVLIGIFFFWGFVAASNTVLIGAFKENFSLSQFQSQLVDTAFYAAYFLGSLVYFLLGIKGTDLSVKVGYKKLLIIGLLLSAIGALGFIPAALFSNFWMMLMALFVVGLGFSVQQIIVNPVLLSLGSKDQGAIRINLAGGINSLGTTIGPLLINMAIFGGNNANLNLNDLPIPYVVLAIAFSIVAVIVGLSRFPEVQKNEIEEGNNFVLNRHVLLSMLAIFAYVGVEVSLQSNFPEYLKFNESINANPGRIVGFISMYWGLLMLGRLVGALEIFKFQKEGLLIFMRFVVSFGVYGIIVVVNYLSGMDLAFFIYMLPMCLIFPLLISVSKNKVNLSMRILCITGIIGAAAAIGFHNSVGIMGILLGGMSCAVLWPCIFAIALENQKEPARLSALLIMMILGGAVIPPLQGLLADKMGIALSYILPLICFAYLFAYAQLNKKTQLS
jgi:FHS family L-fucose permease-like MFS transporter